MNFDGSVRLSVLVAAAALVATDVHFAEVLDGEHHPDSKVHRLHPLFVTQSTVIGHHFVFHIDKIGTFKIYSSVN